MRGAERLAQCKKQPCNKRGEKKLLQLRHERGVHDEEPPSFQGTEDFRQ